MNTGPAEHASSSEPDLLPYGLGVNSFQRLSETTSTVQSTTSIAVWSLIAYSGYWYPGGPSFFVGQ